MSKVLTIKQFAKMGNLAQRKKYPVEVRSQWGKKGASILIEKYGLDYFKKLNQKSIEKRKQKKEQELLNKITTDISPEQLP